MIKKPMISDNHSILILVTQPPTHPLAEFAIRYAKVALATEDTQGFDKQGVEVFFYADGASTANGLSWQTADRSDNDVTKQWQQLAEQYPLNLSVCVSTALARGVTDEDNRKRHQLSSTNIADGFQLVGLSELVVKLNSHKVIQF